MSLKLKQVCIGREIGSGPKPLSNMVFRNPNLKRVGCMSGILMILEDSLRVSLILQKRVLLWRPFEKH